MNFELLTAVLEYSVPLLSVLVAVVATLRAVRVLLGAVSRVAKITPWAGDDKLVGKAIRVVDVAVVATDKLAGFAGSLITGRK